MNKNSTENDDDLDEIDEMILEEGKKSPGKRILLCPVCSSSNVTYYLGANMGYLYQCKDCGYIGAFIIEKSLKFQR